MFDLLQVCDGNFPEENGIVADNTEESEMWDTRFNRVNKRLAENMLHETSDTDTTKEAVADIRNTIINSKLAMQQLDENFNKTHAQTCNGLVNDHTLVGAERDGLEVKFDGSNINDVCFNGDVSTTKEHTRDVYQCKVMNTSLSREHERPDKTFNIKQEGQGDDNDVGAIDSSDDDLHKNDENNNEELMPRFTNVCKLQVR